jgi:3-dehydro-L-gulonate 2-dehydrogenase
MRVPFQEMYNTFVKILTAVGCERHLVDLCAKTFTQNSCDGVYSHGLNMFPGFIKNIQNGIIDIHAKPKKVQHFGVCEVWDGNYGPGISNAHFAMEQAICLAAKNGIGCAAMRNTNHWCRAGTYVIQAAEAGCMGICWTNTIPNMPPWGSKQASLGNNPLAIAIPRGEGHLVLDMAMSQFSMGKMRVYQRAKEQLPMWGGYDAAGKLTTDASEILASERALPIGFWKGSGLSIMLDLLAGILSGGNTTFRIGKLGAEKKVSQVFIAIDARKISNAEFVRQIIEETIESLHGSEPANKGDAVYYPGQRMLMTRADNLANGIVADEEIWGQVLEMCK